MEEQCERCGYLKAVEESCNCFLSEMPTKRRSTCPTTTFNPRFGLVDLPDQPDPEITYGNTDFDIDTTPEVKQPLSPDGYDFGGLVWDSDSDSQTDEVELPEDPSKCCPLIYDLLVCLNNRPRSKRRLKKKENTDKYNRLLEATEGFCAGEWPIGKIITQYCRIFECCSDVSGEAEFALQTEKLKLTRIIRKNWMGPPLRPQYYLTMEASDGKYYEAIVVRNPDDSRELKLLREALYYPDIGDHLQHLTRPDEDDNTDDWSYDE